MAHLFDPDEGDISSGDRGIEEGDVDVEIELQALFRLQGDTRNGLHQNIRIVKSAIRREPAHEAKVVGIGVEEVGFGDKEGSACKERIRSGQGQGRVGMPWKAEVRLRTPAGPRP